MTPPKKNSKPTRGQRVGAQVESPCQIKLISAEPARNDSLPVLFSPTQITSAEIATGGDNPIAANATQQQHTLPANQILTSHLLPGEEVVLTIPRDADKAMSRGIHGSASVCDEGDSGEECEEGDSEGDDVVDSDDSSRAHVSSNKSQSRRMNRTRDTNESKSFAQRPSLQHDMSKTNKGGHQQASSARHGKTYGRGMSARYEPQRGVQVRTARGREKLREVNVKKEKVEVIPVTVELHKDRGAWVRRGIYVNGKRPPRPRQDQPLWWTRFRNWFASTKMSSHIHKHC